MDKGRRWVQSAVGIHQISPPKHTSHKQAYYLFILLCETQALQLNKFSTLRVIKQNERAEELTADHADVIGSITNSECDCILTSLD